MPLPQEFDRRILADSRIESVCRKCGHKILIEMNKADLQLAEHDHIAICGAVETRRSNGQASYD